MPGAMELHPFLFISLILGCFLYLKMEHPWALWLILLNDVKWDYVFHFLWCLMSGVLSDMVLPSRSI